jgi:hypothetical protein
MRNDECIIYVYNNEGNILQSYRKIRDTWTQTTHSNGRIRTMTAEQLLSHLLPPLAGVSPAKLKVVKIPPAEEHI